MTKQFFVYILTNKPYGTLYTGVTSHLVQRTWQHKEKAIDGFTKKYNLSRLVYFEECGDAFAAFDREKKLKRWKRAWKIDLIEKMNPTWEDIYQKLL